MLRRGKQLAGGRRLLVLSLVLALVVAVAGCAKEATPAPAPAATPVPAPKPAATPVPAPKPVATPKPTPVQEPITFRVSHHLSPGYSYSQSLDKWGKAVEEGTNGVVTVRIYGAQSLFKAKEQLDAVSKGLVEAAFVPNPYASSKMPILGATELPFQFQNYRHMMNSWEQGLRDFYNEGYYSKINIYAMGSTPINWSGWGTNSTLIKEPKDFEGKVIRVFGAWQAKMIEPLGAKTAWMPSSDMYVALQKGTVDGYITTWMTNVPRKLYEVAKTWTAGYIISGLLSMWVNTDVWNSLTPQTQKVMQDAYKDIMVEKQLRIMDGEDFEALEFMKDAGMQVHFITPEEAKTVWEAPVSAVNEEFKKELGAAGLKALDIIARAAPE